MEPKTGRSHLVHLDPCRRGLQGPGLVRDDRGDQLTPALREEPVALDEEVLERADLRPPGRAARLVARREGGGSPAAEVVTAVVVPDRRHAGDPVRQSIERATGGSEERARGVEADEPDARHAAHAHVRADVELGNRRQGRPRRSGRRPAPEHAEGDDRDPRSVAEEVGLDAGWQRARESLGLDGPVREEQVAPLLGQKPRWSVNRYHLVSHF